MARKRNPTILVVDDDESNLELLRAHLREGNYDVGVARSGEEAFALALKTPPDLILLDIILPGMNGYRTCEMLKKRKETRLIPIVMVTSLSGQEDKIKGLEIGADDFLTKPINALELLTRIKSLLRMKDLMDRQIQSDLREAQLANQLKVEQIQKEEERRRSQFYRDVILAVTSGKLLLVEDNTLNEALVGGKSIGTCPIREPKDVGIARNLAAKETKAAGLDGSRRDDLVLCVSEAVTNVIKHGGTRHGILGTFEVLAQPDKIQVYVQDYGPGIDFAALPKATLMGGYSTKPSLGYGYTIMLELADRILLATSPKGTGLILEVSLDTETAGKHVDAFLAAFRDNEE
ncbi:MAG: response regulator [Armatimonadetes bacterium]|nr:response regulator [Armatimonadota bacterium]